jgi:phage tail protein X
MSARALLAALLLLSAPAAGCGDSGSGSSGVQKADYVDQVNAICAQSNADVQAAVQSTVEQAKNSNAKENEVVADALEASLPISKAAVEEAAAVPRPAADEDLLEGFFSTLTDSLPLYRQMTDAIRSGDKDAVDEINTKFTRIAAATRPVAEDYGLDSCIPDTPSS